MRRPKSQLSAQERARWLAELAKAVDEAQQIVWQLSMTRVENPHFNEIYGRLETAREEIERLQHHASRAATIELHQDWSELTGAASALSGVD